MYNLCWKHSHTHTLTTQNTHNSSLLFPPFLRVIPGVMDLLCKQRDIQVKRCLTFGSALTFRRIKNHKLFKMLQGFLANAKILKRNPKLRNA